MYLKTCEHDVKIIKQYIHYLSCGAERLMITCVIRVYGTILLLHGDLVLLLQIYQRQIARDLVTLDYLLVPFRDFIF